LHDQEGTVTLIYGLTIICDAWYAEYCKRSFVTTITYNELDQTSGDELLNDQEDARRAGWERRRRSDGVDFDICPTCVAAAPGFALTADPPAEGSEAATGGPA
jgi:hypothetical protein